MNRRLLHIIGAGFWQLWGLCIFAQAPGSLDSAFQNHGRATFDFGQDEHCSKVLTDAAGNIYLCGNVAHYGTETDLDFLVAKLDKEGNLDPKFGQGGVLMGDFGRFRNSRIVDADLRSESLCFIGDGNNGGPQDTQRVFIGKVDLKGDWEAGFGENGLYSRKFLGEYTSAGAVKILEDGRIVFCGMTDDTVAWHIELPFAARLLADGTPDNSFGETGCITWSLAHGLAPARGAHNDGGKFETILPMRTGGYLLGGVFYTSNYGKAMLMMVDESGNLDDGFGENGLMFPDINPGFTCTITRSCLRGKDIFLGATLNVYQSGEDFALLRTDSTGQFLDYQGIDFGGNEDRLQDMLIDHNGHLLTAGYSRHLTSNAPGFESNAFAVAALEDFEAPAGEFADQGMWWSEMNPDHESGANALCETPDGKLLVVGYVSASGTDNYSDLIVARLLLDSVEANEIVPSNEPILYPNPAHERIFLKNAPSETLRIWDAQGRLVLEVMNTDLGIDICAIAPGLYLLEMRGTKWRFVKQ